MYHYTLSIDTEGLQDVIDDLTERINAFSKRRKPFRITTSEEPMGDTMGGTFIRFHLVVTPDFVVKNERQAWLFCQNMKAAADEIQAMNDANYVLVPPPRRGPGGPMR